MLTHDSSEFKANGRNQTASGDGASADPMVTAEFCSEIPNEGFHSRYFSTRFTLTFQGFQHYDVLCTHQSPKKTFLEHTSPLNSNTMY